MLMIFFNNLHKKMVGLRVLSPLWLGFKSILVHISIGGYSPTGHFDIDQIKL